MKKIQYLFAFLITLIPLNSFSANVPGYIDPPVTVHNETSNIVKVSWSIDMPKQLKFVKYEASIEPKKSVTLKDGITYYATSNSKTDARVQKNKVEVLVEFLDKSGREIKDEAGAKTLRVFGKHEIQKDKLLTLNIYIKDKMVEFKEVEKK